MRKRIHLYFNADADPSLLKCGSGSCSSSKWCESATIGLQFERPGPPRLHFRASKVPDFDWGSGSSFSLLMVRILIELSKVIRIHANLDPRLYSSTNSDQNTHSTAVVPVHGVAKSAEFGPSCPSIRGIKYHVLGFVWRGSVIFCRIKTSWSSLQTLQTFFICKL
jgi:hypothetical protein